MSNREIKSRFGPVEAIKWRLLGGETVVLKWPDVKSFTVDDVENNVDYWYDLGGAKSVAVSSDDPNLHYRPYLEKYIGKQGQDWMWKHDVGCSVFISPEFHRQIDRVEIRLSRRKNKWATMLRMKWGEK